METIHKSTFDFLKTLEKNNDRDWFNANKDLYLVAQENMHAFADQLILEMNKHDEIETVSGKKSLYRIYNDVRFSKNKLPYNARFAFRLARATKWKRGGYYVNIKPGNCFMACGFFAPNPEDLKRIRQDIDYNYADWNKILNAKKMKSFDIELRGNKVETTPRGFAKDHPAIDLIRHKQFILRHDFTEKEVLAADFMTKINNTYKAMRPFLDYMSEVLTTDGNGELLV
jgi:uncharacterized protein (TIGR02453 family)